MLQVNLLVPSSRFMVPLPGCKLFIMMLEKLLQLLLVLKHEQTQPQGAGKTCNGNEALQWVTYVWRGKSDTLVMMTAICSGAAWVA
jgi:hypothetical protein